MPSHQTYHNCTSWGKEEVLYLCKVIRNPRWLSLGLIGRDIFNVFSKTISFEVTRLVINVPLGVHSSEVLLVFGLIRNPRLPLLIGQSIFILLFQKSCLLCQQTFKKCFFRGSNVFLQFLQPHFSYIVTYKFIYLYIII